MATTFLHCVECDAVFRPSAHDRAPEYRGAGDGVVETVRDDCMAFLVRHARHALRTLRATEGALHQGSPWDPTLPVYWRVCDGGEPLVVEGRRAHTGAPLAYRLLHGQHLAEDLAVEVPAAEIRTRVDHALFPGVAPERKLDAFVEAFKEIVWGLDPSALEVLYDVPGEPLLSMARLPVGALEQLGMRTRRIFGRADARKITALLTGTDDPEAFALLVRRTIRLVAAPTPA